MTQAASAIQVFWNQNRRPYAVADNTPTSSGDWFKAALATSAIGAAVALMNMWADMREIRNDMNEVKSGAITQKAKLQEIELRVKVLEVRADR